MTQPTNCSAFGRAALGTALLLSFFALPAGADWLVLRTGERAETRGPWKVKGKLVVFTRANGTLASLRLAEVDLEASDRATAEAKAQAEKPPEAQPPPPRKESVRTLTDADFARKPPPDAAEDDAGQEAGTDGEPTKEKSPVAVASWNQVSRTEGDGLDLVGALRNNGNQLATDLTLTVKVYNDEGELLATVDGVLASTALPPGGTTSFRVPLPGVFTFAKAAFETRNTNVTLDPAPEPEKAGSPP